MKNKIKPAQYEPYSLLTPFGNLIIESGIDLFNIDVSRQLNGDFNFNGSLKVNQFNVLSPDNSNQISDSSFNNGCRIMAGSENNVSGIDCCVVVGYNNVVSGERNTVLFGDSVNLEAQNTVAIGYNISINHNGAAVFADSTANPKVSYAPDSITIEYTGGAYIKSPTHFSQNIFSNGNLSVTGNISGISFISSNNAIIGGSAFIQGNATITGNTNITGNLVANGSAQLGATTISGQRAITVVDLNNYSGFATGTYSTKTDFSNYTGVTTSGLNQLNTGKLSISSFNTYTGSTLQTQAVVLTGNQNISGEKSFKQRAEFCNGLRLPAQNNCDRYVPKSGNASGDWGHIAYSGNYLYIATGVNKWGRVQISSW